MEEESSQGYVCRSALLVMIEHRLRADKQQLPGILIGGECPGVSPRSCNLVPLSLTIAHRTSQHCTRHHYARCSPTADAVPSEEAVEFNELDQFLRLNEDYNPFEDEKELLPSQPIGVPGAYSPAQMHPHHQPSPSPQPTPTKAKPVNKRREGEVDAGEELGDARLAGVNVTEDDLLALVEELGLGGDEASDLVKGLTGDSPPSPSPPAKKSEEKPKDEPRKENEAQQSEPTEQKANVESTQAEEKPTGSVLEKTGEEKEPASADKPTEDTKST